MCQQRMLSPVTCHLPLVTGDLTFSRCLNAHAHAHARCKGAAIAATFPRTPLLTSSS